MLQINSSLFVQIANFLILLFILNLILFRPIRRILGRRSEETLTLEKGIEDALGLAKKAEEGVEKGRLHARKEGFAGKEALKGEGVRKEKEILQAAGEAVENKLGAAKRDMEAGMAEARKALDREIAGFSRELATKIVGRNIQ
jgi:F-type H+-transporting ATPase subunit b